MKTSEFELIDKLHKILPSIKKPMIRGIGDDCAVLDTGKKEYLLLSTDSSVENVHFNLTTFSFYDIGIKAMSSALSDIAAMGGKVVTALVSLGISKKQTEKNILDLYKAFSDLGKKFSFTIGGGNISRSETFWVDITVVGSVLKNNIKCRSGAKVGDLIFVSGPLGSSALGLALLNKNQAPFFEKAHKNPTPRLDISLFLSKQKAVTSLIDISDGLLADLGHILETNNLGAEIIKKDIPVHSNFFKISEKNKIKNPIDLVLCGGEDYELLWTVSKNKEKYFMQKCKKSGFEFYKIGQVTSKKTGLKIFDNAKNTINISKKGHDHFHKM